MNLTPLHDLPGTETGERRWMKTERMKNRAMFPVRVNALVRFARGCVECTVISGIRIAGMPIYFLKAGQRIMDINFARTAAENYCDRTAKRDFRGVTD